MLTVITLWILFAIAASTHYEAERYYERLAEKSDSVEPRQPHRNEHDHNVWRSDGLIRSNGTDIFNDSGFERDNDVDFSNDLEENYFDNNNNVEDPDFDDNDNANDVEENNDTEDKKCFRVSSLILYIYTLILYIY